MSLYPTKTRVALLEHAVIRAVRRVHSADPAVVGSYDEDTHDDRKVTSRCAELEAAGWIWLDSKQWSLVDLVTGEAQRVSYWDLTDLGHQILEDRPGSTA